MLYYSVYRTTLENFEVELCLDESSTVVSTKAIDFFFIHKLSS